MKQSKSVGGKPKSDGKKGKKKKKGKAAGKKGSSVKAKDKKSSPERVERRTSGEPQQPYGPRKRGRKNRVNVSLPVDLSRRFTEKAAEEDRYLTDMVLDAYRDHYAVMRDEYMAERGDVDLPFRPRRRKAATGRVTHMLYLAAPEVGVIDGSAVEIGLLRSEFVSQLLEREL